MITLSPVVGDNGTAAAPLLQLLRILYAGVPTGRVVIEYASRHLGVHEPGDLPVGPDWPWHHAPAALEARLDGDGRGGWAGTFRLATRRPGAGTELAYLPAAAVTVPVVPSSRREQLTPTRSRLLFELPEGEARRIEAALAPLPAPSFLISAVRELTALWLLAEPLDLRVELDRAVALQRRLAECVGATVSGNTIPGERIALPGTIVRSVGSEAPAVQLEPLDLDRRYAVGVLEAALDRLATAPTGNAA